MPGRAVPRRVALVVSGAALSTLCYAATVKADLGLGPLFTVQQGLSKHTGISLGHSVMVIGVLLVVLAAALRTFPGPGTVALPFLMGFMLDGVMPHMPEINGLVLRLGAVVVATWFMCCGGAIVIRAQVGAPAIDAVMLGLRERTGWNIRRVRLGMEGSMLTLGWLLGGTIGVGTVMTGLLVGPALHFWLERLDKQHADEIHITV